MGGDKLWIDFWGRPVWRWGLDTLLAGAGHASWWRWWSRPMASSASRGAARRRRARAGRRRWRGASRSVWPGLWALTGAGPEDDAVLVHDAARPAVSAELMERDRTAARGASARSCRWCRSSTRSSASAATAVVGAGRTDEVAAAQTPQARHLGALRAAIEESHAWGRPVTDEAGALRRRACGPRRRRGAGQPQAHRARRRAPMRARPRRRASPRSAALDAGDRAAGGHRLRRASAR